MKPHNTIWDLLGIPKTEAQQLLDNKNTYYVCYAIPKRNQKSKRLITAPQGRMKDVQRAILTKMLYLFEPDSIAHGFVRGRSPKTNAEAHLNQASMTVFDLSNCFPNTTITQVAKSFYYMLGSLAKRNFIKHHENEDAEMLAGLTTYKGVLAQGLPTSPVILNIYLKPFDAKLNKLCRTMHWTVTRYADDITVSSKTKMTGQDLRWLSTRLAALCREFQLVLNNKKFRIKHKSARMQITGVVANEKANLSRNQYRSLRAQVHNYFTGTVKLTESQKQKLRGRLEWLRQLNPAKAEPLIRKFASRP